MAYGLYNHNNVRKTRLRVLTFKLNLGREIRCKLIALEEGRLSNSFEQ